MDFQNFLGCYFDVDLARMDLSVLPANDLLKDYAVGIWVRIQCFGMSEMAEAAAGKDLGVRRLD